MDPAINSNHASADMFDPARLRLSQDYGAKIGVKKALLTVPVRRPHRQEFIQVRQGETWQLATPILEAKEDRESFLLDPALWGELPGEVVPKLLFTAISRQGVLFLWPVRLPGENGRHDSWSQSALEAAQLAQQGWVRVAANMSLGAYDVFQASADLPDPEWPDDVDFKKLLEVAFRDRFISTLDHPIVRKLRGEL